ncbi:MAG: DUF6338 family protein [Actinomycetota bacterium]|nr:DUF6338 family protein [Actinomycetota bacterium]MDQ5807994.1 DUF6338 family protein [Actinomycetota bacterium]
MFDTLTNVVATIVFLLPGFVVADIAQRERAGSASLGDQRALLRALSFSVVIHLAAGAWTWDLMKELEHGGWSDELLEVTAYVLVVALAAPTVLGLLLNMLLVRAERGDGRLRWWHYALGARDARDAWDFAFQRYRDTGVWVLVHFRDAPEQSPRVVIGKYGEGAAFGQSPSPEHDLFLRDLWTADEAGQPVARIEPPRSLWVAASQIAELYLLETGAAAGPEPPGAGEKTRPQG